MPPFAAYGSPNFLEIARPQQALIVVSLKGSFSSLSPLQLVFQNYSKKRLRPFFLLFIISLLNLVKVLSLVPLQLNLTHFESPDLNIAFNVNSIFFFLLKYTNTLFKRKYA